MYPALRVLKVYVTKTVLKLREKHFISSHGFRLDVHIQAFLQ